MRSVLDQLSQIPGPSVFRTPSQALKSVISKDGHGVYASADHLFKGAVFGRDSLEVAEDLLFVNPKLVHTILLTIASLQGEVNNPVNEEEPGKIIHEYRRAQVDGQPIDSISADILKQLSASWGGDKDQLAYFGSVDSTPHFIRALGKYCETYGPEILAEKVKLRSGRMLSVAQVTENAIDWIQNQLNQSSSGLLEFKRHNPHGIANQVWKDSQEFYIHENGQMANHNGPIASIEVQALVYDALLFGSDLLPSKRDLLLDQAETVRRNTIKLLWRNDEKFFALGLDYDNQGKPRIIKTLTANPAEMLESTFFDNLAEPQQLKFISAISREIMGSEFLTDAGIRSRALSEARLVSFWDYHGSFTSWPKETYDIAEGLRHWGMPKLAEELENRLLNVVKAVRSYPEFIYVDARGRVLGMPSASHHHGELVLQLNSNIKPEKIQAWTVSAIVAITSGRGLLAKDKKPRLAQKPWQQKLETEILRTIPRVKRLRGSKELAARYPTYPYELKDEK